MRPRSHRWRRHILLPVQRPSTVSLNPAPSRRAGRVLAILITIVGLGLSPVLAAGYLRLDDYRHILENPGLVPPSLSSLAGFWTKPYFGLYIPVTYTVWWTLSALAHAVGLSLKQGVWLFHALNWVLHLANAVSVFLVVQTLLRRSRTADDGPGESIIALAAGLFFALHPLQVETVAWISECKGELSLLFGLWGIWSYYRPTKRYVAAILFVLAMLAKPSAIVFPGFLLLVNRILFGQRAKEAVAFPALVWGLLLPLAFLTKHLQPDRNMSFVPGLWQRLFVAFDALGFYAGKLAVPYPLALDYGRSPAYVLAHIEAWRIALSTVTAVGVLGIVACAMVRPRPGRVWLSLVACGASTFALALAPVLGLVPFEFQDFSTVADHYAYVAVFGAALVAAGLLLRSWGTRIATATAVAVLLVLLLLSFAQARLWRSTESTFEHTLAVNRRSYLAHYSIAAELMDRGNLDAGIRHNLEAIALNPDYLYAQMALGVGWIRKGDFPRTIDHYERLLATKPSTAGKRAALMSGIYNNLGMALHQVGRDSEGTEQFRKAVEVDPWSVTGYANLASAAFNDGHYLDAIVAYEKALALSPDNPSLQQSLARARRAAQRSVR
jgi:protein O-mannosyl-transferase